MHVLIIKTSSLGDVIHTLPALTDAGKNIPDIHFDWVIEPAFAEIPQFHHLVENIIPAPIRYFRKNFWKSIKDKSLQQFCEKLPTKKYDYVIDAQGLIKSGIVTFLSRGIKCGYDRHSAWEPLACLSYDKKYSVDPELHAITRIRQLFSKSLNYSALAETPDYGIFHQNFFNLPFFSKDDQLVNQFIHTEKYVVFLHGTTRDDKRWPEEYWIQLIQLLKDKNIKICLAWGNEFEKNAAERLANHNSHAVVLPKLNLTTLAGLLSKSVINIAVDTGLGHLSAALNKPTISLYGPTDPKLIGTVGENQIHIRSDSKKMSNILPEQVYEKILITY